MLKEAMNCTASDLYWSWTATNCVPSK